MSDRYQFMAQQAYKFDDMVQRELGMSANEALKAFSEGRLKGSNIDQQLQQARREGWEHGKKQADSLLLDLVDVVLESKPVVQSARRAIAAMEYGGEK